MKRMNKAGTLKYSIILLFIRFTFITAVDAQEVEKLENIKNKINAGSKYMADVLLDENGKSKCEYSIIDGVWADYEPAWHTGQLIYALSRAHDITNNASYLESAKKAANWWCHLQINDNPKLNGMLKAIHGAGINYIVFSTVSDGTAGMFHLCKKTGELKYAVIPTQAGKWMFENMYIPEKGLCYDMADTLTGEIQKSRSAFWPDKEKQDLNDVARPNNEGSLFLDMYKFSHEVRYKDAFINLSNSLVDKQGKEGLWMDFTPNDKRDHSIHPRFNLWYAESLLDAYDFTGDKKYLQAALKTAQMYKKMQQKDGTFFYTNFTDGTLPDKSSVSGSTVAFAGIIYLRLLKAGYGSEFEKDTEKCYDWLVRNNFPENHPDPNLRGAFIETKVRMNKGKAVVFNRDVGTIFAVRFLADYYDFLSQKTRVFEKDEGTTIKR
jgi:rhamnogalacturonyl hydrolase YesR